MEIQDLQFYPTPKELARHAARLFKNPISNLLEPSAGNGDLLDGLPNLKHSTSKVDLIEIDVSRHEVLRTKGNVVGTDFMDTRDLSMYSQIFMNPPFRVGVKHVLHAWKHLFAGEIVAILNAAGVRNPRTADECRLSALIDAHGTVEYLDEAFMSRETMRKTTVEIALVYLAKEQEKSFWVEGIVENLEQDQTEFKAGADIPGQSLSLGVSQVSALVRAFNTTWEARKQSLISLEKARHFNSFFRQQIDEIVGRDESNREEHVTKNLYENLAESYQELKKWAWTSVLNTSDFQKHLTRKVVNEVLNDFEKVSALAFTEANIYGFMQGFAMKQGDLNKQMVMDLFDSITSRQSDNYVLYRAWKSNEQHRIGMAIRRRRFIIGGFSLDGWRSNLSFLEINRLREIDKVFALVDGKREPVEPLAALFENQFKALKEGERLSSSYFDVRYYPGIGTVHLFPKDQRLIDRINLLVGQARQWMPEDMDLQDVDVSKAYKAAEKITTLVLKKMRCGYSQHYDDNDKTLTLLEDAAEKTGESSGFFMDTALLDMDKAS
ncbi:DUF4942 domain-containing protein [Acidithiobacillus thiooxidans]|uniref:DUF4942 domain-containing protein n=1 Tax=Acidithiobacillus thiooxidans TaxID=930 RepID=UPI001C0658A7|nr:DUF4942 domain-containing protein [Acidithiobacillus thiooxidans]MBU2834230.1 DUF4942 domain-containing protein [Acidithiobacillus thiooxidans]